VTDCCNVKSLAGPQEHRRPSPSLRQFIMRSLSFHSLCPCSRSSSRGPTAIPLNFFTFKNIVEPLQTLGESSNRKADSAASCALPKQRIKHQRHSSFIRLEILCVCSSFDPIFKDVTVTSASDCALVGAQFQSENIIGLTELPNRAKAY